MRRIERRRAPDVGEVGAEDARALRPLPLRGRVAMATSTVGGEEERVGLRPGERAEEDEGSHLLLRREALKRRKRFSPQR